MPHLEILAHEERLVVGPAVFAGRECGNRL
jgi:hypothetical protein